MRNDGDAVSPELTVLRNMASMCRAPASRDRQAGAHQCERRRYPLVNGTD